MEVTRYATAPPYAAAKHEGCYGLRLQGFEVSKTRNFWLGLSHFLVDEAVAEGARGWWIP